MQLVLKTGVSILSKQMMHIAYFPPYFHKIFNFPLFSFKLCSSCSYFMFFYFHWRRLVKDIGWALGKPKYWGGQKVIKSDKCMGAIHKVRKARGRGKGSKKV